MTRGSLFTAGIALSLLVTALPDPALAQNVVYGNPYGASLRHPGSARQCEEIEVVMTSGNGHEWIYAKSSPGLSAQRTWTEKCGWGAGPCVSDAGAGTSSDWNPSIGYRGPLHVKYLVTAGGAAAVEWWMTYMGPNYTSHHYSTYEVRTQMTVTDAGKPYYLNLEAGTWTAPPVIPADGTSSTAISVRLMGSNCAGQLADVALSTTHGTLQAGITSGKNIIVRTSSSGTASATLVADTTPGVATVTASANGVAATDQVYMYGLTLTAPDELAADGAASGIVTAALDCNGTAPPIDDYLRNKITIALSTSAGTLVLPGGTPAASVSGHPGPLGTLTASLQSTTTPQTANLRASSGGVEAFATAEFTGPKVTLDAERTEYWSVPSGHGLQGSPGSVPIVGTAQVPFRDVVEPSRYGRSTVEFTATLSLGASSSSGKQILLTSPQRDAAGAGFIDFPASVTTTADGTVTFTLTTDDLHEASIALPHITLVATYAADPTVSTEFDITTVDNFAMVQARYETAIGAGAVRDDSVVEAIARMSPRDQDLLLSAYPGVRNDLLASGAFSDAYAVAAARHDDFLANTSPWWQHEVLSLLNNLQWTSYWSTSGSGDERWLLNGLHFAPLFVEGDRHLAVVVYPQGESWSGADARVFDPWIQQQATTYSYAMWKGMLASPELENLGSGVDVQTQEFTPGTFGGSSGPSDHYPANGKPYYADVNAVPAPWDPAATPSFSDYFEFLDTLVVDCPVFVTIEDGMGRRAGYVSPGPTVDEIPGALSSTLEAADGSMLWLFTMPKDTPVTVRLRAYATGTMSMTIIRPGQGRAWVYRNVALTNGDTASMAFVPAATVAPALVFTGGRTVPGVVEAVGLAGASSDAVLGGGSSVTIGGVVLPGGALVQQGATVTIGGRPATGVTVVNGSTLRATVPAGLAEGPADVVVTNPGGAAATLSGGLDYYLARHYFAEGATSDWFDTRLALLNPTTLPASATLEFLDASGAVYQHTTSIPAMTRATVDPEALMPAGMHEFSTVVAATQHLVVDRTMSWDARGYGSHAETSLPAPATTWYLAEGATHSGIDLFYLLQNANDAAAHARVTFLLPAPAAPVVRDYELPPQSRTNVWVDLIEGLASTDVSATIVADRPIVVERALYLNSGGKIFGAGHESAGVTAPATRWFLAEGATGDLFDLFVLVANPNAQAATVEARFLLTNGTVYTKSYPVAGHSRFNIWVDLEEIPAGSGQFPLANAEVSTTITSTNGVPIIVERAMWWPGGPSTWYEAHNSPAATSTGTLWALADGESGGASSVETYVLIANTSAFSGAARVTLVFDDGTTVSRDFALLANSRFNVAVGAEYPESAGRRFGTLVESLGATPAQLVVERAMYSNAEGTWWAAGTNALATKLR
ncbi:MAG: hypothetical protein JNM38_20125 [Acidobacteria bacterium]|nr:hypothetical protein [Acidobacteriota bacterium]